MTNQRGAGTISLLALVFFSVMGLVLVMKVVPFYSDDVSVQTVFENLEAEGDKEGITRHRIEEMIEKRFSINGISDLTEFVEVTGQGSAIVIEMEYERRTSFFSNIELVATFEHYVEISE